MTKLVDKEKVKIKILKKAAQRFKEALSLPETEIVRDAVIQRFEFCFELAWKFMQQEAQSETLEAYGPKNSIRQAAKIGLIDDPKLWLNFLDARNLTTHTYNEELADEVYKEAKKFLPEVEKFMEKVEKRE